MEQLVLLLLIGLISFINWLIKKSAEAREARRIQRTAEEGGEPLRRETEPAPAEPLAPADPDESMRKLMEALGLPAEASPPVQRREPPASPPPLVVRAEPPPVPAAVVVAPPPLPKPVPQRIAPVSTPKPSSVRETPVPTSTLRDLLASPDGLRKAVMLSEILGPAKALR